MAKIFSKWQDIWPNLWDDGGTEKYMSRYNQQAVLEAYGEEKQ